ncbi:helix-turn-helix domain-containing protein [Micromonospora sp. NPDC048999]|uniref:helix-turn-helix domain-containing protein n=1 Tax=Micromonospora sp. NPDC048999 TaxID=3155391 RepID=UPI0033E34ED8
MHVRGNEVLGSRAGAQNGVDVMERQLYRSLDQVAGLLGLHVRTVRGYVRDGRLRAARVGRQYRIIHVPGGVHRRLRPSPSRRTPCVEVRHRADRRD